MAPNLWRQNERKKGVASWWRQWAKWKRQHNWCHIYQRWDGKLMIVLWLEETQLMKA